MATSTNSAWKELRDPNKPHVARRVLLAISVWLVSCSTVLGADITTDPGFEAFLTYYYQNPQPTNAPQALDYFVRSPLFRTNLQTNGHMIEMVAYFFGRLAELHPALLRDYQQAYAQTDEAGQSFLLSVFRVHHDEEVKRVLQKAAETSSAQLQDAIRSVTTRELLGRRAFVKDVADFNQLDFLWIEFQVTGDKEPIVKIIDVLGWDDRLRNALDAWLAAVPDQQQQAEFLERLRRVGITVNTQAKTIEPSSDLDCLFSAYLQASGAAGKPPDDAHEIRRMLRLTDEDLLYMATKGSAMWSLQANARQHPKILAYCVEERNRRQDKSAVELALIVALASKDHQHPRHQLLSEPADL